MRIIVAYFLFLLAATEIEGRCQEPLKKTLTALRISSPPQIDGILDEAIWQSAEIATDFVGHEPYVGKASAFRTEVRIAYDETALYVGARMWDNAPDSILRELGQRDEALDLNADVFAMDICPFNDDLNGFGFGVSASGVLVDIKNIGQEREVSWDAVWICSVNIDSLGWTCEMKIPYSAIRFPNVHEQVWGLNFWRQVRRIREWSTWSLVNKDNDSFMAQAGLLYGIHGLTPPVRLSVNPYLSAYVFNEEGRAKTRFNGGLDLKYGINQSYTLDMTLIPDFGQVESDELVLNLSPFEIQYDEKRPFFTEGDELFSRGGIFYSRRIGGTPSFVAGGKDTLQAAEVMGPYPMQTQLFNAVKVTGRNSKGFGTGFLNAVTRPVYATALAENGDSRQLLMQPVMNYSFIVLDKSLKNNSYVSFANSNVLRTGESYLANVAALEFDVNNKGLKYGLYGLLSYSQKQIHKRAAGQGIRYYISGGKRTGPIIWHLTHTGVTRNYDHNDMGYNQKSNFTSSELLLTYRQFKPVGLLIQYISSLEINYNTRYEDFKFSSLNGVWNTHFTFKNYMFAGIYIETSPLKSNDFYEPRIEGRFLTNPAYALVNAYISSDYRKTMAIDMSYAHAKAFHDEYTNHSMNISPRFRLSDRLLIIPSAAFTIQHADDGFVASKTDTEGQVVVYIGHRNTKTVTNSVYATYRFSANASLSLRARHYWSVADYYNFYKLQSDGSTIETPETFDANINYNIYTLDMGFHWNFAPGSELSLVWKQFSQDAQNRIIPRYIDNYFHTVEGDMFSNLSLKVIYYIDYQNIKNSLKS